ncbi:30S ribosomal protein S8 [Fontisphaera persica]|jgi:small subunit ribosomal protein S8|uniref:30S ribosomal protein S8 n=1 Tax=Fontisphaera persica TaxID=2974023 RepID=UPI0024BF90F1|nr:30S ribosomal protein S8 [Fontisphaera persica]WCJ59576.1 30S ribosomal protein S8 [Fontisphaera persica]
MSDPIADMLTRIRNAAHAGLPEVEVPHSRLKESLAAILKREGYIREYTVAGQAAKTLKLFLKYEGRRAVLEGLQRVSKPGRRIYTAAAAAPRVRGGLGIAVLSTSRGLMTDAEARKQHLGGEVLCYVW